MKAIRWSLLALLLAMPIQAAVFTVTKTADTLDGDCGDRDCSLREAVSAANIPDQGGKINVVVIPAGIYVLTRAGAGEDGNAAGDLDIGSQMILAGAGAGSTILDGGGLDRVLDAHGPVEIFGVTIRNGRVDGNGGGLLVHGAGSTQPVLLHRSVVSGNLAQNGGSGGGIAVVGYLEVHGSAILENQAEGDGGGISAGQTGTLLLRNVTVSGNLASGSGGGLDYQEELAELISGSTIAFNEAHVSGGGIHARGTPLFPSESQHLSGSIVAGNDAPQHPDCTSVWRISAGYNVFGTPGCAVETDKSGTLEDPLPAVSETLSGGFGPTPVHPLPAGSPALDMVAASHCEAADQVGQARSAPCDAGALELSANPVCIPGGSVLCLQEGRFRVTASWRTAGQTEDTPAQAVPLTDDSGTFWFFAPDNLEIMVKVLNGCPINQHWWVFSSGLTNVGVTLRVEDLVGRRAKTYTLPPGTTYEPRLDTGALDCSPALQSAAGGVQAAAVTGLVSRVLEVTKTADTDDGSCDHDCSLREAVIAANSRQGTNVIVLRPGVHQLSIPGGNEQDSRTGDLDVKQELLILGAGAKRTILDGGGIDRVLDVGASASLELHGATVRGGRTADFFSGGFGGGIEAFGPLRLFRVAVTGNSAQNAGGGVFALETLVIRDSTVSGNSSLVSGGGISAGTSDLENVTVSGNQAADHGGGLSIFLDDETSLRNLTVTGNSARFGGGIATFEPTCPFRCWGPFEVTQTIIAGNTAAAGGVPSSADCFEMRADGGHNVFGIGNGCNAGSDDAVGTLSQPLDPRLTPLGDHGGPTPTHGLLADSPAVDLAPSNACGSTDQRGRPRPVDGEPDGANGCDAGAFERQPACQPDEHTLCLGAGDRFRVTATWQGPGGGHSGPGGALPLAVDTGAFWFFEPDNLELTVKVLDGCGLNDRFWVFLSGLTDVQVDVAVEDTRTGEIWTHHHAPGTPLQPRLDTNALDVCQGS